MLDMGFIRDIRKILKVLPEDRQNLLFSATFSAEIRRLATDLLNAPVEIQVAVNGRPAEGIRQIVHPVDRSRKRELLSHKIGTENWQQVLVFTRTKHGANRLAAQLEADGLNSAALQIAGSPRSGPERLQDREGTCTGSDGCRGAWARHRAPAACRQFRAAACAGRLRPPHRADGPCRSRRSRGIACLRRRAQITREYREAAAEENQPGDGPGIPAGCADQGGADLERLCTTPGG